jgi:hypothetical protein
MYLKNKASNKRKELFNAQEFLLLNIDLSKKELPILSTD